MPSREEIAGWLKEAEAALKDYELLAGISFLSHEIQCLHEDFADRAAQIEAMCCETCKHYFSASGGYYEKCRLKLLSEQGKEFACFSFEPKEG